MSGFQQYQSLYDLGFDKERLCHLKEKHEVQLWAYANKNPFTNRQSSKIYKHISMSIKLLESLSKLSDIELQQKGFTLKELPVGTFMHEKTFIAKKDNIEFLIHYDKDMKQTSIYWDNPDNEIKDVQGMLVIDDENFSHHDRCLDNLFKDEGVIIGKLRSEQEEVYVVMPGLRLTHKTVYIHRDDIKQLRSIKPAPKKKVKVVEPWLANAEKIHLELLPNIQHLNKEKQAKKIREEMVKKHENKEPGMTKRGGGKVPAYTTILRHVLTSS